MLFLALDSGTYEELSKNHQWHVILYFLQHHPCEPATWEGRTTITTKCDVSRPHVRPEQSPKISCRGRVNFNLDTTRAVVTSNAPTIEQKDVSMQC